MMHTAPRTEPGWAGDRGSCAARRVAWERVSVTGSAMDPSTTAVPVWERTKTERPVRWSPAQVSHFGLLIPEVSGHIIENFWDIVTTLSAVRTSDMYFTAQWRFACKGNPSGKKTYFTDAGRKKIVKVVLSEGFTKSDERASAKTMAAIAISMLAAECLAMLLMDINPYTVYMFFKKRCGKVGAVWKKAKEILYGIASWW